MLRKLAAVSLLGALAFGQTAQAETHTVLITETGFFPEITYVNDGDSITFINADNDSHRLNGVNDEWTTDLIGADHSATLVVWQGMKNNYYSQHESHERGVISFAPPPLE